MLNIEKYRNKVFIGVAELAEAAKEILTSAYLGDPLWKASRIPNERTIRYYLTEGLLPPAEGSEGTSSVFGFRHLITLLLIKRLQAFGLSNRTIRRTLEGRDLPELEKLLDEPISIGTDINEAIQAKERGQTVVMISEPDEVAELAALMRSKRNDRRIFEDDILCSIVNTLPEFEESRVNLSEAPIMPPAIPATSERWERFRVARGVELHFGKDSGLSADVKRRLADRLGTFLKKISDRSADTGQSEKE